MIYEIVCNITGERYIGSTFEPTIARRIAMHRVKTNKCCSKQIIDRGDYYYGLLEKIDFECTRDELRMFERKWYDALECINNRRPFSTKEEKIEQKNEIAKIYRDSNREHLNEKKRAHYEENKEHILEKHRAQYEENKEHILEKQRAYKKQNKEKISEKKKALRLKKKAEKAESNL